MEKQLIISVGREFGSAGHEIAEDLAKYFDIPLYDYTLLNHIEKERNLAENSLKQYDEVPKSFFFSKTIKGHSNSLEENVANIQFEYMKRLADEGKSFVIVGRCSEHILKDCPGMVSLFILGEEDRKARRVMEKYGLSEEAAKAMMRREDYKRKNYHNYYCSGKWGDSRNYDLSINSGKLGVEKTVDLIVKYIKERFEI